MMEVALSKTALTRERIIEFWGDGQPHSVQEFGVYLQKNNMMSIGMTYIRGALYTATQQEILERIDRRIYRAGKNINGKLYIGMKGVLQRTMGVLSSPINVTALTQRERELIPKLQELYQECESLLNELESEGDSDEISK